MYVFGKVEYFVALSVAGGRATAASGVLADGGGYVDGDLRDRGLGDWNGGLVDGALTLRSLG